MSALSDTLQFWRALAAGPRNIGAIAPSSQTLARAIARQIDPATNGPVLELGPGTGVITQAILARGIEASRLTLVEYDSHFAARLAARFGGVHVIEGDAFDLGRTLGARFTTPFAAIVSGLPLLNFPMASRHALIGGALARLAPGAPLIQFSYGAHSPVTPPDGCAVTQAAFVWANLPPARVWVYKKLPRVTTLSDAELDRYARHLVLREVGGVGQAKIRAARVLIVGAGGLGSPAALYLAAAGVGTIGLVDDDTVSLSNLQRQILYRTADVGRPKTQAAADTLTALNDGVRIEAHALRLTAANVAALTASYDIVADGSDNFETRFLLNDACYLGGKTLVSAAVTEFEGQLAAYRKGDGLPCYRCLFPAPPPPGTVPNCSETGVLGAVTGVMGTLQAVEILKEITGIGAGLAGKLLIYDALTARFRTIAVPPDPACRLCGAHADIKALG